MSLVIRDNDSKVNGSNYGASSIVDQNLWTLICPSGKGISPDGNMTPCVYKDSTINGNYIVEDNMDLIILYNPASAGQFVGMVLSKNEEGRVSFQNYLTTAIDMKAFRSSRVVSSVLSVYSDTISTTNTTLSGRMSVVGLSTPINFIPEFDMMGKWVSDPKAALINTSLADGVFMLSMPNARRHTHYLNAAYGCTPASFQSEPPVWKGEFAVNTQAVMGPTVDLGGPGLLATVEYIDIDLGMTAISGDFPVVIEAFPGSTLNSYVSNVSWSHQVVNAQPDSSSYLPLNTYSGELQFYTNNGTRLTTNEIPVTYGNKLSVKVPKDTCRIRIAGVNNRFLTGHATRIWLTAHVYNYLTLHDDEIKYICYIQGNVGVKNINISGLTKYALQPSAENIQIASYTRPLAYNPQCFEAFSVLLDELDFFRLVGSRSQYAKMLELKQYLTLENVSELAQRTAVASMALLPLVKGVVSKLKNVGIYPGKIAHKGLDWLAGKGHEGLDKLQEMGLAESAVATAYASSSVHKDEDSNVVCSNTTGNAFLDHVMNQLEPSITLTSAHATSYRIANADPFRPYSQGRPECSKMFKTGWACVDPCGLIHLNAALEECTYNQQPQVSMKSVQPLKTAMASTISSYEEETVEKLDTGDTMDSLLERVNRNVVSNQPQQRITKSSEKPDMEISTDKLDLLSSVQNQEIPTDIINESITSTYYSNLWAQLLSTRRRIFVPVNEQGEQVLKEVKLGRLSYFISVIELDGQNFYVPCAVFVSNHPVQDHAYEQAGHLHVDTWFNGGKKINGLTTRETIFELFMCDAFAGPLSGIPGDKYISNSAAHIYITLFVARADTNIADMSFGGALYAALNAKHPMMIYEAAISYMMLTNKGKDVERLAMWSTVGSAALKSSVGFFKTAGQPFFANYPLSDYMFAVYLVSSSSFVKDMEDAFAKGFTIRPFKRTDAKGTMILVGNMKDFVSVVMPWSFTKTYTYKLTAIENGEVAEILTQGKKKVDGPFKGYGANKKLADLMDFYGFVWTDTSNSPLKGAMVAFTKMLPTIAQVKPQYLEHVNKNVYGNVLEYKEIEDPKATTEDEKKLLLKFNRIYNGLVGAINGFLKPKKAKDVKVKTVNKGQLVNKPSQTGMTDEERRAQLNEYASKFKPKVVNINQDAGFTYQVKETTLD